MPRDTRAEWEALAERWDAARRRAWPDVAAFAESFPAGARVLDLAAGNGRHAAGAAKTGVGVVAADFSRSLLHFAASRGLAVMQADARALPLRPASFDGALFVAALHCIPGRASRIGALAEMRRAVRPGGRALVTVWSCFRDGKLSGWTTADADVAWGDVARYYHFYSPVEFATDCRAAGWSGVRLEGRRMAREGGFLPDNWFAWLEA
ncbi:MAG TPA: class I SAM-dependent methyltransferase [Candidatus Thermoplasmatota archaeon]|nr:class I SAM-dependent methyltransferase [Candidatus Thermoplasmatota archaeon]